jgi:hypothetical protein
MTAPDTEVAEEFTGWCVVEMLGHRQIIGQVDVVTIAGGGFLRVATIGRDGEAGRTQLIRPASIYALHPVDEDVARRAAVYATADPLARFQLEAGPSARSDEDDELLYDPDDLDPIGEGEPGWLGEDGSI